jgi:hypothetical protein
MSISRRATLLLLGGGVVSLSAGGVVLASMSDEEFVHAVLERHLGSFVMQREELAAFVADLRVRRPRLFPSTKLTALYRTAEKLNVLEFTRANLPGERGEAIVAFERHLLGEFFAHTDVGFRSEPTQPVTYQGAAACLNPFAQFT